MTWQWKPFQAQLCCQYLAVNFSTPKGLSVLLGYCFSFLLDHWHQAGRGVGVTGGVREDRGFPPPDSMSTSPQLANQ